MEKANLGSSKYWKYSSTTVTKKNWLRIQSKYTAPQMVDLRNGTVYSVNKLSELNWFCLPYPFILCYVSLLKRV